MLLGDSLGLEPFDNDGVGEAVKLWVVVGDCVEELVLVRVPDLVTVPLTVADGVSDGVNDVVIDIVAVSLIVGVPDGVSEGELPSESDDVGVGDLLPVFVVELVAVLLEVVDAVAVRTLDTVPDTVLEPVGVGDEVREDERDIEGDTVAVPLGLAPTDRVPEREDATVRLGVPVDVGVTVLVLVTEGVGVGVD